MLEDEEKDDLVDDEACLAQKVDVGILARESFWRESVRWLKNCWLLSWNPMAVIM
jgi:hypothetical protein